MESVIPVLNFKNCLQTNLSKDEVIEVGTELVAAFSTVGFAYLANTGISKKLIKDAREASQIFFASDTSQKAKFARNAENNYGYIAVGVESINPERPGDFKEAFNISGIAFTDSVEWPNNLSPNFKAAFGSLMKESKQLAMIVLNALAVGMELEDEHFFEKSHQNMHSNMNQTTCRTLYYPPLTIPAKPGQIRLGEHSDYGSITLLYQDNIGGLQVQNLNGEYVDGTPIEDTVLVNIGDLLQFWTKGKMKSTKHRVLIPEEEIKKQMVRQSIAYFVHPDDDVLINMPLIYKDKSKNESTDPNQEGTPLTALDYVKLKFSKSY